jgi:GGDEF domain-containing protein
MALMMLDIDFFKSINDMPETDLHVAGMVAERLRLDCGRTVRDPSR